MHVVQLLAALLGAVDIEIVTPWLPEMRQAVFACGKSQGQLTRRRAPRFLPQVSRHSLLQGLQHGRGSAVGRFADEQMDVLLRLEPQIQCQVYGRTKNGGADHPDTRNARPKGIQFNHDL